MRLLGQTNTVLAIRARKPGPAFNVAMASAFADGADYLYRTNDDTTPEAAFASAFAAKLAAFTVRAPRGRLSALSVLHSKPGLHGAFVWARRLLNRQK